MIFRIFFFIFIFSIHLGNCEDQLQHSQEVFDKVGITQKLGEHLPDSLVFTDDQNQKIHLHDLLNQTPIILTPIYYQCPMLCSLVLNGLVKSLKIMKLELGKDYQIVSFSFNPRDHLELAQQKKKNYLDLFGKLNVETFWKFLFTEDETTIQTLTDSIGFTYAYDPIRKEYAHAATIIIISPQGKIYRYFNGTEFSPKDLKFALMEASQNKVGTFIDQLIFLCYHYDPATGKYGFIINNILRIAGFLTLLIIATYIVMSIRKERIDH